MNTTQPLSRQQPTYIHINNLRGKSDEDDDEMKRIILVRNCEYQDCQRRPQKGKFCGEHKPRRILMKREYQRQIREKIKRLDGSQVTINRVRQDLEYKLKQEQLAKQEIELKLRKEQQEKYVLGGELGKLKTEIEQRSKSVGTKPERDPDYLIWAFNGLHKKVKENAPYLLNNFTWDIDVYKKLKGL